jgi:hypothetical protein
MRSSKKAAQRNSRGPRYTRLEIERLEDRQLMSVLAYHGGPILTTPHYQDLFIGSQWGSTGAPSGTPQLVGGIGAFMNTLVRGKYIDLLRQYGVNPGGPSTDPGTFGFGSVMLGNPSSNTVSDREIQSMLDSAYRQDELDGIPSSTLYMVFTDVNLSVADPSGNRSWGYHNYFHSSANGGHDIYYAVVPDQTTNPSLTGPTDFQGITLKASQEFVDGVTDPTLQGFGNNAHSGWWVQTYRGLLGAGDFDNTSNQQYGQFNGYVVTRVLNNVSGRTILPNGGATFNSDNPATHAPFVATALGRISATNSLEEAFAIDANGVAWYQRQQEQTDPNGRPILSWGPWMLLGAMNGFGLDGKQIVVEEFDGADSGGSNNGDYDALWVFAKDTHGQIRYIESDQNGNFGDGWSNVGRNGAGDPHISADFFAVGQKVEDGLGGQYNIYRYLEVFAVSGGQVYDIVRFNPSPGTFETTPWHPLYLLSGGAVPVVTTLSSSNMGQNFNYAQTLVAVDNQGSIWTVRQENDHHSYDFWDKWLNLEGPTVNGDSVPAAALRADGLLQVFVVSGKGVVWTITQSLVGWNEWTSLDGFSSAAPDGHVTVTADNYGLEVFVLDQSGSLWTIQQTWATDDFSDSKWFQLGGSFAIGFNTFGVCFDQHVHVEFLGIFKNWTSSANGDLEWATQVLGSRAWN